MLVGRDIVRGRFIFSFPGNSILKFFLNKGGLGQLNSVVVWLKAVLKFASLRVSSRVLIAMHTRLDTPPPQ